MYFLIVSDAASLLDNMRQQSELFVRISSTMLHGLLTFATHLYHIFTHTNVFFDNTFWFNNTEITFPGSLSENLKRKYPGDACSSNCFELNGQIRTCCSNIWESTSSTKNNWKWLTVLIAPSTLEYHS